jgi:spoIIIJ-associated protein
VSQADNAGTVTSGETAGQALAAEHGEEGGAMSAGAGNGAEPGTADLAGADLVDEDLAEDDLTGDDLADEDVAGAELAVEDEELAEDEDEDAGADDAEAAAPAVNVADLEQESEIAADYVEGLLDVADLDGDIDMDVEGDRALVSVVGATLQELIGPRGEVLEALQELTRLAVHRQTGARTRIMLDVGGYRAQRRVELTELGRDTADEVRSSGVPRRLAAMTPFERKIVHDAVAASGLRSESEGEEPNRRVVVFPAG